MKRLFVAWIVCCPAFAGEYAVLHNGFRIAALSHEVRDATIRLTTKDGTVDMPAAHIARFEAEEYVKPAAPPPVPAPAALPTPKSLTPQEIVNVAALKHGLRPEFVRSVAAVESGFRTNALSPKGAMGLMQLMPGTAAELGVDPKDPRQNAEAGARYLKDLLLKYKDSKDPVRLALAAYNAGPHAVDRYHNIPPYAETQQYVEKVLKRYLAQLK
ncbi:MAG TPA: lytic transglycosylase domain-containing protein [Bryobacteraceae bacterium]|nr:lytic transglycosylase domain-containing protein [Bryobacteraceae bacterium]